MPTPISNTGAPATLPAQSDPIGPPPPPPAPPKTEPAPIAREPGAQKLVKQNQPAKALPPPCTNERNKVVAGAVSVAANAMTAIAARNNPIAAIAGLIKTFEASFKEGAALHEYYDCVKK